MNVRVAMLVFGLCGCQPDAPRVGPSDASGDSLTDGSAVAAKPTASGASSSSAAPSSSIGVQAQKSRPAPAGMCEADGALRAGSLRSSRVDLHDYARLLADLFRVDLLVFGDLPDPRGDDCPGPCFDLDERIEGFESALKLSGARVTMRSGVALVGALKSERAAPALAGPSRDVDLSFFRFSAAAIAQLLSDVHKKPIKGFPDGEITIVVRGLPALKILGLMAEAAGTSIRVAAGALEVQPGGALPPVRSSLIEKKPPGVIQRDVFAVDHAVEELRASVVVAAPKAGVLRALVAPKVKGGLAWVVRVGDFVGKERVLASSAGELRVHARVERIHCQGIDVVFEGADPTAPSVKLVIPLE